MTAATVTIISGVGLLIVLAAVRWRFSRSAPREPSNRTPAGRDDGR